MILLPILIKKKKVKQMLSEYKEEIDTQKEVLKALPRNNIKNNKIYQQKIEELLGLYSEDKQLLYEEISKRYQRYTSNIKDNTIESNTKELNNLYCNLPLINTFSSSYEKSGLDVVLYNLGHYYTVVLEEVNKDILKALNIFKTVGIVLDASNFNYSYYANMYMKKFIDTIDNNEINNDLLKESFSNLYWKCPNIINHIALNFKHLYYQNKKKFDLYYDNITNNLVDGKIYSKYVTLYEEREEKIKSNRSILLNKFLNKELDINNYSVDKIGKAYQNIVKGPVSEKVNNDIKKLNHTLFEYKNYLDLKYIIDDIKSLYKDKEKYKNIFSNIKKEIVKRETKLMKENKKVIRLLVKGNTDKFDYSNTIINNIISELKDLYDELDRNYFLEKINSLNPNTTLYDLLYLASSNYNYLTSIIKKNNKDINEEISKLKSLVYYPYINIINNILINDEKDIALIIMDRYNLFGLDITKEELSEENLVALIDSVEIVLNSISMNKLAITDSKIKFIENASTILGLEQK